MKTYINPNKKDWSEIIARPVMDLQVILQKVQPILDDVKLNGDAALRKYNALFDGMELNDFSINETEINDAVLLIDNELKTAINQAKNNIEIFHAAQIKPIEKIETMPGVICWRKSVGIEIVGLYIPGGTAPLFSTLLMLGIPAKLAGCKQIILCTPADKNGKIHPAILYTASVLGIKNIFKIGGAQAIAAMAYGTETVPKVYKIFGPGNQYVTAAKQLIQQAGTAIDMPAGPSEVCVMMDETAVPAYVAADLLSQAEHGVDSQVLLVSNQLSLVNEVEKELKKQLALLPRMEFATKALENSRAIVMENIVDAIDLVNEYAAEHLIISRKDADELTEKIINAGSIFIGNYSPESVGDYASGTNHTLPTNGFAKAYSGVSIDSFVKKITIQKLSKEGLNNIGNTVIEMAMAEGLQAHAEAVRIRRREVRS